jgi:hypothetical protein
MSENNVASKAKKAPDGLKGVPPLRHCHKPVPEIPPFSSQYAIFQEDIGQPGIQPTWADSLLIALEDVKQFFFGFCADIETRSIKIYIYKG